MKTLNQFVMESYLREEYLEEKNVPTSPEKWARAKAAAKSKFAVYPSAYANGWASKKYKSMGGGWKSVSEEQGVAEGEVKQFPKKHRGDLEDTHSCVKCGGDLQGGTYMGHKVKVCIPCKQVYLPPNTGIDQRGNKVDEQGVAEGTRGNVSDKSVMWRDEQDNMRVYHKGDEGYEAAKKAKEALKKRLTKKGDGKLKEQGVAEEVELDETAAWQRKEGKRESGGLNQKGVESYRREHPGSKLKTAVTTKPSKLKPGSKAANRRKSFCARMSGMKKRLTSAKTANDPDSRINKSLRKWNC